MSAPIRTEDASESGALAAFGDAAPCRTLDEVAALLVQTDGSDPGELVALRDALAALAMPGALPGEASGYVGEALREAEALLRDAPVEPGPAVARIGRAIEAAMLAPAEPPPRYDASEFLDSADPELLGDFLSESRDYAAASEAALLTLEADPNDAEAINTVFRAFHTVKGTSAFLGLPPVTEFAHHSESLFDRFRSGELQCTGELADLSLRAVDLLKELLDAAERARGGRLTLPANYHALLDVLSDAAAISRLAAAEGATRRLGDLLVDSGIVQREVLESVAASAGDRPLGEALVHAEAAPAEDVARALRRQRQSAEAQSADATLRVRTDRLDHLVEMVGELVIAQAMVAQDPAVASGGDAFTRKVAHAGKIVRELQEMSVAMRMVPLKPAFMKMARLVRDVARKSGKQVELVTEGEDTEIDRTMVDVITDPLVHMVRNAIDHGIETPEEREAAGKPRTGRVRLAAYHAGGNVVVELRDDGRGLDREKILRKAVAKGLVGPERVLPESEVFHLIFAPGFSTADQVTDLSGRGVGMDVVKRNVESLRGRVDIDSEAGRGSVFSIRLPLTLAVTDGMLIRVAGERYVLPTVNIDMSFRPQPGTIFTVTGKGEGVMHRGALLPVVRLHRLFGVEGAEEDPSRALLVLVSLGERRCALLVDELLGQQQVVAKPLGAGVGKVPGISGGTILGDGRVGLILDPGEILMLARDA